MAKVLAQEMKTVGVKNFTVHTCTYTVTVHAHAQKTIKDTSCGTDWNYYRASCGTDWNYYRASVETPHERTLLDSRQRTNCTLPTAEDSCKLKKICHLAYDKY